MKIIIFDVGNAACSIISSPNKYGIMIDCGSNSDKINPVDAIIAKRSWLDIKPYSKKSGEKFELGLLHITHPDDDHVRNAKRILEDMKPCLLQKRIHEEFPQNEQINIDYIKYIDSIYRVLNPDKIEFGFNMECTFEIPMEKLIADEKMNKKLKNNSSILKYLEFQGVKILFAGDMEKDGWEWLANNDINFTNTMRKGLDILIAPHHGHKSGFPKSLFDLTGKVKMVIHSKGSEGNIDGTDVSSQYSDIATGLLYRNLNDKNIYLGRVLTTRSNGNIYIEIDTNKTINVWTDIASSNHEKISKG